MAVADGERAGFSAGSRGSLRLRRKADTLFAELQRRDVESPISGLETPKCVSW